MKLQEVIDAREITVDMALRAHDETGIEPTLASFGGCVITVIGAACGVEGQDVRRELDEDYWMSLQNGYDYEGTGRENYRKVYIQAAFDRGREICRAVTWRAPDYPPAEMPGSLQAV